MRNDGPPKTPTVRRRPAGPGSSAAPSTPARPTLCAVHCPQCSPHCVLHTVYSVLYTVYSMRSTACAPSARGCGVARVSPAGLDSPWARLPVGCWLANRLSSTGGLVDRPEPGCWFGSPFAVSGSQANPTIIETVTIVYSTQCVVFSPRCAVHSVQNAVHSGAEG